VAVTDVYVGRARAAILTILADEHAVVHPELEARISEAGYRGDFNNIDPHHVTTALRELSHGGSIEWIEERTRGGSAIKTIQPTDTRLRSTKVAAAAARKRLLYARYSGWSQGTKRHPQGLVGPAGEEAVRLAIRESSALQPAAPGAGEVNALLGVTLPGPLDSAGYLVPIDASGLPQSPVTILFEVKNLRSWIYPSAEELYQLLHKAIVLQTARPEQPIVPVFVCRRAHQTTFWMSHQLGFVTIDMGIQYVGDVEEQELLEVRNELHFRDLAPGKGPSLRVRDRLTKTLPRTSVAVAEQWSATASDPAMVTVIEGIRRNTSNRQEHNALVAELRRANSRLGRQGGW
jgi:hypothetical protein